MKSMLLVDILARELTAWPDQYYQIYQDSGGSLHGTLSNDDLEDCAQEDLPFEPVSIAWDGSDAVVDRAEWQAAVDALNAPKVVEWYGVGLPPVGTVCQFKSVGHHDDPEYKWCIYRGKMSCGGYIVEYHHHTSPSMVTCAPFDPALTTFRPIRTQEQIAAEEREKAIEEIRKAVSSSPNCKAHGLEWDVAGAIYDAGYRKQVTK